MSQQSDNEPNPTFSLQPCVTAEEKALRASLLREALPACQPQEGSPANTFTESEIQELQAALPNMNIRPRSSGDKNKDDAGDKIDICQPWVGSSPQDHRIQQAQPQEEEEEEGTTALCCPQEAPTLSFSSPSLDWHSAPQFNHPEVDEARYFREDVRAGRFTSPTNGVCPGFLQCNLVVLPAGQHAFDFLLFCQRNSQACPLIEVCDTGSPIPFGVAPTADLRTDCPKYAIYRDGELDREVTDVTEYWPENSVAFLIGCSFSYDGALLKAGIPLRSAEQGRNVPMYRTNLACRPAGSLRGNMVVSMKPISALQIAKEVEITSRYRHAHGGPVCIGLGEEIGVPKEKLSNPDWGEAVDMRPGEVPVFHACGVTPQAVLMDSKVPFAITHAAGHMFVTDMPSDMGL